MVGATDTIFCAAVSVVPVFVKMDCIMQTMISIPETMFPVIDTVVSTIKAMVFLVETTFCGTKTLFSEAEPIVYASETGFSVTEKTVSEAPAAFVFFLLDVLPITPQLSAWYSWIGLTGLALLFAFALYAFHTSLGGQPMFGRATLEGSPDI